MSSTTEAFGFRASYHNSGRITAKAYTIASGYAQNVFSGDLTELVLAQSMVSIILVSLPAFNMMTR